MPNENRSSSAGAKRRREDWHVAFARALGQAARVTATELGLMRNTIARAADSATTRPGRRRRRTKPRPLNALLNDLGKLVARHSQEGYSSLQADPTFWKLIARIHARRPSPRDVRAGLGGRAASQPSKKADAIDAKAPATAAAPDRGDPKKMKAAKRKRDSEASADTTIATSESEASSEAEATADADRPPDGEASTESKPASTPNPPSEPSRKGAASDQED